MCQSCPQRDTSRKRPLVFELGRVPTHGGVRHKYLVQASTQHTPFFVRCLRHPRLPTLLECYTWIRGGIDRAKTVIALALYVPTQTSSRMMPMSIKSTSMKKITSIIAMTLSLIQMKLKMLVFLASPTTIPARMTTSSPVNRKKK